MNYSIKCGKCKGTHANVNEIKACYGAGNVKVTTVAKPVETVEAPITEKQEAFMLKLLAERPCYQDVMNLWPNVIAKFTKVQASQAIELLLAEDAEVKKASGGGGNLTAILEGIDDGYFALPCKTGNNDLDFIRIGTNQGRGNPANKGKRRVQRFLGGHGPIQIEWAEQIIFAKAVAALTAEERSSAKELFGREVGACGCCGKSLTDETSRALGIGPVCNGKSY